MSHLIEVDTTKIVSLDLFESACESLGLELVRGQETFRSFRRERCSHAVRVPGDEKAYEIGLIETTTEGGEVGFALGYDHDMFGIPSNAPIREAAGRRCEKLIQAYVEKCVERVVRRKRARVRRSRPVPERLSLEIQA